MQTRTLTRSQWTQFFDSLSRVIAGSRATLEVLSDDLGAQLEVEESPLSGISYDPSGLELHFATRAGHLVHRIENPERTEIEEPDDGLISALEIQAPGEPVFILRLKAPVDWQLLPAAAHVT
jgi:Family of unknown function (DUF5335)